MQVRTGAHVANEEILGFAKLFNDELTLDNISRLICILTTCVILELHLDLSISIVTCLRIEST